MFLCFCLASGNILKVIEKYSRWHLRLLLLDLGQYVTLCTFYLPETETSTTYRIVHRLFFPFFGVI